MTKTPKFSVFKSSKEGTQIWRWRLIGANGEIVAQSEGYKTRASAKRATQLLTNIVSKATPVG